MTEAGNPIPSAAGLPAVPDAIPRLPVLGWASFAGAGAVPDDSLLAAPHLEFTTSGRAAIWHALKQLGVGAGDRVLVPTYHCPTMVAPAVHAGAEPVFYPVTSEGVDTSFLARLDVRHVKVLIVAHFFGRPVPMAWLRDFCDARGIALIEDCAHALLGTVEGKPVGAWGDFAVGSLTKFLPVPEGGCLASWRRTVDLKLEHQPLRAELKCAVDILEIGARYRRLRGLNALLSSAFRLKNAIRHRGRRELVAGSTPEEGPGDPIGEFDTGYALSAPTQVARLTARCMDWGRIRRRRRERYAALVRALGDLPGLRVLYPDLPEGSAPYVLPVWVKDPEPKYRALRSRGCPVFRWEWLWPGTPILPGDDGWTWSRHVFQLPCHQEIEEPDFEWLVTEVREMLGAPGAGRASAPGALQVNDRPRAEASRRASADAP